MKLLLKATLYILLANLLVSCSQESNSFLSRNYHNLSARYNCYFLAKEKMIEVEEKLFENHSDDFNYILSYYPLLDTNFSSSLTGDLDYIFEKAKLPITKHKNSNWVAESYNIIGKSKWLGNKIDTAIYVHKYVVAKSDDLPGKQNAQIALLRIYVSQEDIRSAEEQFYQLKKQKIFEDNSKDYNLAMLEYYYYLREFSQMIPHLEGLIPLVKNKDLRSRLRFIIGQIHQRNGNDKLAYNEYKKSLKRHPPYEIEFNAKLNLSQVTNIEKKEELHKINKYYDKMLTDDKNDEYQGRIYFERAKFELKQGNLSKAVRLLNKSLNIDATPQDQKAYAYLLLGQLHYSKIDTLPSKVEKYKTAKLYYDSTVTSMSPRFENAQAIIDRDLILDNFVEKLETIENEERLQKWARLSPSELEIEIEKQMAADKKQLEREAAIKRRNLERENSKSTFDQLESVEFSSGGFFAYDPISLASQKLRFAQRWNNRPLEDNWRRSDKEENEDDFFDQVVDEKTIDTTGVIDTIYASNENSEKVIEIKLDKNEYTNAIPKNEDDLQESIARLLEAKYRLGKIYLYDLEETANAREIFEEYLNEFPDSKYEAEVIYLLFIICEKTKSCTPDKYKELEGARYPNSLFYKLMKNEDYLTDNEALNLASHELYEKAYNQYKKGNYITTRRLLEENKAKYPLSNILDKIEFLSITTYAYTDQLSKYYFGMQEFLKHFGTSSLKNKAEEILANKPKTIIATDKVEETYERTDSLPHYFIAIFKPNEMPFNEINGIYKEFRQNYFRDLSINTKNIEFSDSTYMIVNREFKNFEAAKVYYDRLMLYHDFGKHLEKVEYSYYIVTEQNYKTLLASRNINAFREFYRKQYRFK